MMIENSFTNVQHSKAFYKHKREQLDAMINQVDGRNVAEFLELKNHRQDFTEENAIVLRQEEKINIENATVDPTMQITEISNLRSKIKNRQALNLTGENVKITKFFFNFNILI